MTGSKILISVYPEKNIVKAFEEALECNCLLLFDEADALFGKRFDEGQSCDRHYNKVTNILMQQIESYPGIIILTTNRELAIDKAFERRLLYKLKFDMPDNRERIEIWHYFLKDCDRLNKNINFEALGEYRLTGGQIKNIVIKTVAKCANQFRNIDQSDLIEMIQTELITYTQKTRTIGFLNSNRGSA